jgi:hypothetical protein
MSKVNATINATLMDAKRVLFKWFFYLFV